MVNGVDRSVADGRRPGPVGWCLAMCLVAAWGCASDGTDPTGPGGDTDPSTPAPGIELTFADTNLAAGVREGLAQLEHPDSAGSALRQLDLSDRGIRSLAGLEQLGSLEWLDLSHNAIVDVAALSPLRRLVVLDLSHNALSDLGPLAQLDSLRVLLLDGNSVADVGVLLELAALEEVSLHDNPLGERSVAEHLPALRDRGVEVGFPGVGSDVPGGEAVAGVISEPVGSWPAPFEVGPVCLARGADGTLYAGTAMDNDEVRVPALLVWEDGGTQWRRLAASLPYLAVGPIDEIHSHPLEPGTLVAHVENGFVGTSDGGRTWEWVPNVTRCASSLTPVTWNKVVAAPDETWFIRDRCAHIIWRSLNWSESFGRVTPSTQRAQALSVDAAGTLYFSTFYEVYRSRDGGDTVEPALDAPTDADNRVLDLAATGFGVVYVAATNGLSVSTDGGDRWLQCLAPEVDRWGLARIRASRADADRGYAVVGGWPPAGSHDGLPEPGHWGDPRLATETWLFATRDLGRTWHDLTEAVPGTVRDVVISPLDGRTAYVASSAGVFRLTER